MVNQNLKDYVSRAVSLQFEIDNLKEDIGTVFEECKATIDIQRKQFNNMVKAAYNKQKVIEHIQEQQEAVDQAEELGF